MLTQNYKIIPGEYSSIEDVKVSFMKIIEIEEPAYSENDVLNTIAFLEQQKIDYCKIKDNEIEVNNQMLLKIRAINRIINITE